MVYQQSIDFFDNIFLITFFDEKLKISIFDCENKGLEIDNNDKLNENNTQQRCPFHDQAMHLEWFCKSCKQFINLYDS